MKIDIYVNGKSRNTEISFDGHMIEGVLGMDLSWELNKPQILKLEILADDLTMHNLTGIPSKGFQQVFITKP